MPEPGRFRRRREDFDCESCGSHVKGSGYTDHCPNCLTSKHVDNNPGDRASDCKALMKPVSVHYESSGFTIHYVCSGCGMAKNMGAAANDNNEALHSFVDAKF